MAVTADQSIMLTTHVDGDTVVDPGDVVATSVTVTNISTNTDKRSSSPMRSTT